MRGKTTGREDRVRRRAHSTAPALGLALAMAVLVCAALTACGSSASAVGGSSSGSGDGSTSGSTYTIPSSITPASFSQEGAVSANGGSIDASGVADGYVAASATSSSRLKFQVMSGEMSYNYDLPGDGTPIVCPINMGDGTYTFRIMQNTSGNNYVEITSTTLDVSLKDEFEPFLRPNVFCSYSDDSACVAKARELAQGAQNQGDVVKAVCTYITENVQYDSDKASQLRNATGYIPNPDETLSSGKGICFDYASLGAAMLRSLGIPTKVLTGYVSPDNIYHSWVMVYIDGSWTSAEFKVEKSTWSRVDLTFAAAGGPNEYVGDAVSYTDRYTY